MSIINQFYRPKGQSYTDSELAYLHLLDIREVFQFMVKRIRSKLNIPVDGFDLGNCSEITVECINGVTVAGCLFSKIYTLPSNWDITFKFIILFGFSVPPSWSPKETKLTKFGRSYITNDSHIIELFAMVKIKKQLEYFWSATPQQPRIRIKDTMIQSMVALTPIILANASIKQIASYIVAYSDKFPEWVDKNGELTDLAKLNTYITRIKKYKNKITESYPERDKEFFPAEYSLAFTHVILQYS